MVAGAATVVAGAQGLGGPEEESGLWAAHWHPQGPVAQPHLRQPRGGASGLQVGGLEVMEGEWSQFWEF